MIDMDRKKYKILLVIRWPVSGLRTFICYTYKYFDPSQYDFTILLPETPEECQALENGLKHLNPTYIKLPFYEGFPTFSDHYNFEKEIIKTIIANKFDLIHSHGCTAGVYASLPAYLWRIPHIVTLHELLYDEYFTGKKGGIKQKILSFLLSKPDIIHLVSKDAKTNLLEYLPGLKNKQDKLIPILSGIETRNYCNAGKRDFRAELNLPENTFLIGFLGRFRKVKGFQYLVDALEYLEHSNKSGKIPLVLTFGITGFILEEMEIVKQRQLDKYVHCLPLTLDVAAALRGLDAVVMPSLAEACGLLAMESMVVGTPVIGTSCFGLREVLKDTPNVMVPPGDGAALGKAIANEMKNPSRAQAEAFRGGAAGRFDVKKPAAELEKIVRELINGSKKCQTK